MLFLISPAKALDYETPPTTATHTQPLFVPQASELIEVLRDKSPQEIAELMDLSDQLSAHIAQFSRVYPRAELLINVAPCTVIEDKLSEAPSLIQTAMKRPSSSAVTTGGLS